MIFQLFIRWLSLLKKDFGGSKNIFFISTRKTVDKAPLLLKYFPNINTTKKLKDLSFLDLFFNQFAGYPQKENLSFYEKLKRFVIRIFFVNYEKAVEIWNLVDIVFLPSPQKFLLSPNQHVVNIYKTHFPHFQVEELTEYKNPFINRILYFLAKISKNRFLDTHNGITVFTNLIKPTFILKSYRLLHPNKVVILRFHDHFDEIDKNPNKIREELHHLLATNVVQKIETYNHTDANLLKIDYRPNGVNSNVIKNFDAPYRKYLYTFVGFKEKDSSRLNDLDSIRNRLYQIYPSAKTYINEYTLAWNELNKRLIPYLEYLELIGQSEIMVDMYRVSPNEGFSYRIPEALLLNKKVITNRTNILKYDFYDPSRFFIIGHDSLDRLESFIEATINPLTLKIIEQFDCSMWWKNLKLSNELC